MGIINVRKRTGMKRFVFIIALIATSAVYVPEVAYSQISDGESDRKSVV